MHKLFCALKKCPCKWCPAVYIEQIRRNVETRLRKHGTAADNGKSSRIECSSAKSSAKQTLMNYEQSGRFHFICDNDEQVLWCIPTLKAFKALRFTRGLQSPTQTQTSVSDWYRNSYEVALFEDLVEECLRMVNLKRHRSKPEGFTKPPTDRWFLLHSWQPIHRSLLLCEIQKPSSQERLLFQLNL